MTKREKPLPNRCTVYLQCEHLSSEPCVYHKKSCGESRVICISQVARANAMVLELQRMGFTVELKKKEGQS